MAEFNYRGRNQGGELVTGIVEALTAESVASQLIGNGVTPIAIDEKREAKSIELPNLFAPKVQIEELIIFSRQMFSLSRSGVPINQAMRSLAASAKNERLQEVLSDIELSLNSGINLTTAMSKHPDVFDKLYVSMVRVGENSGQLEAAFKQLGQYLELEKDTRRRVVAAVRYPMFVLIAISVAIVVLNIWVIPVFADLFSKFGSDLPLPTKILIGTSNFFVNYWPVLLVGLIAAIFAWRRFVKTEGGALWWDARKLGIPLVGGILERAMLARFNRSFSLMLKSGVSLIQALELCAQAVGNSFLAQKIRDMRGGIQRGDSLLRTASKSEMFTPLVLQMIQVGEETGRVDELLEEVALFYEEEVDYDLKNLSSYIEPVLIAAIAGLVMILALGIFLPMWDMYGAMSR
jgi:MSHA biogenesis protein MshG